MWDPAYPFDPTDNHAVDTWDPNGGGGQDRGYGDRARDPMYGIDRWDPNGGLGGSRRLPPGGTLDQTYHPDPMYGIDQWDPYGGQRRRRPEDLYGTDIWDPNGGHRTVDPLPGGVHALRGGGFGSLFGRQGPYGWR